MEIPWQQQSLLAIAMVPFCITIDQNTVHDITQSLPIGPYANVTQVVLAAR